MALQALFQLDFNRIATSHALEAVVAEHEGVSENARSYAEQLVVGTYRHLAEIDAIIREHAVDWKPERMPSVDRNIARLAIYELLFGSEDLTPNIVINEAVELAKTFGTEESGRFINGILGALVKKGRNDDANLCRD